MKNLFAFTLAETLIVMGIIGVVAALTLPNLNSSTGEKEKVAKLQKIYSNLQDAFGRAESVYGPVDEWFLNESDETKRNKKLSERFGDFLKISKSCDNSKLSDCIVSDFEFGNWAKSYANILADGTSLAFTNTNQNPKDESIFEATANAPEKQTMSYIFVDIDGKNKGKNEGGRDIFGFLITTQGIVPLGSMNYIDTDGGCISYLKNVDVYCTAWIIENDNMDYLKCADKLSWTDMTKKSCK